jgi:hypothetical protein
MDSEEDSVSSQSLTEYQIKALFAKSILTAPSSNIPQSNPLPPPYNPEYSIESMQQSALPSESTVPTSSFHSLASLLGHLDMIRYEDVLDDHNVTLEVLKTLQVSDVKVLTDLGIPFDHAIQIIQTANQNE